MPAFFEDMLAIIYVPLVLSGFRRGPKTFPPILFGDWPYLLGVMPMAWEDLPAIFSCIPPPHGDLLVL